MEDWIIDKISEKGKLSKEDVLKMVADRRKQFPELTEDAILRMLATENGIVPLKRDYKVKEITQRINHINVTARIKRRFPPRKVSIKGREARVMNFVIEDETGEMPVVTWDENYIEKLIAARDGENISIANAYSKENTFNGIIELNLGNGSAVAINHNGGNRAPPAKMEYKKIGDINDGETAAINGFITRLFANDIYLVRCSICKKKVDAECDVHKDKALSKTIRIRGILDDGLRSCSITFFDRQADALLKLSEKTEIKEKLDDISFGMYQVDVVAKLNKFNENNSLTARSVSKTIYERLGS